MTERTQLLYKCIDRRVLLLDGSMGVMIQSKGLGENDFRGSLLSEHPQPLKGNNDILCLTSPEVIAGIHREYLEAGADIIETNTFNATRLSQKEYSTDHLVRQINTAGAQIARREADRYSTPERPRFVAGSIGPTGIASSMSADINDPASRPIEFAEMSEAFEEQAGALIDGGVDMLLIETIFDSLNAKAAIDGAKRAMRQRNTEIPLILSMTVSDRSGRLLSGHTAEAFLAIIAHAAPLAVGFNCSAGPTGLAPFVRRLAAISPYRTILYPNAGLPDSLGNYSETPERFVSAIMPLLREGTLNIAGGCCGTTPAHIARLRTAIDSESTPHRPVTGKRPWIAGLDEFADDRGFINIGERCNVAGSRKFLRLIKEKNYSEAVAIARKQVADGAMILDINMDDGLLETRDEMCHFLRLLATDPEVASVPWMIDSSDFDTITSALRNTPGRAIVNSISLKHGEEEFISQATIIKNLGAATVVMAFDEEGQATTYERKTAICRRAYDILTTKVGMDPRDIIFDPNVLTIATGMPEHDRYGLDFIRAIEWIHSNLPGAKTSGGLSNLSFAFRGNNYLRQAMHAVFLYHAIRAGLSMAIMDPSAKVTFDAIPPQLLELLDDAILCRRKDAADRLIAHAQEFSGETTGPDSTDSTAGAADIPVEKRLEQALAKGDETNLEADLTEAIDKLGSANAVVEGPLMAGMEYVGRLFESGKMFLPQVVKSARTMHRAVEILRPSLEAGRMAGSRKGTFLLATVKGDVHDIGKNIAAVVLRCNNFEVIDLGVQVEAQTIADAVRNHQPDFIGLSGLISPSLGEMVNVATTLREAGISTPIFVGGAATSELHTALKIAPAYGDGIVVRVADASQNPVIASRLLKDRHGERERIWQAQEALRNPEIEPQDTSRREAVRPIIDWDKEKIVAPSFTGTNTLEEVSVAKIRPFINWIYFYNCWNVTGGTAAANELHRDAEELLERIIGSEATMRCRTGFFNAYSEDNNIHIETDLGEVDLPTPRQKPTESRKECHALADYIAPQGYNDHIGCFAVTIGEKLRQLISESDPQTDSYGHLLLQSLCDRLAEATSEWLHYQVRHELWGYAPDEQLDHDNIRHVRYQGIRPAVGYPSLPDQRLMHTLDRLLGLDEIGIEVTENGALSPSSSVAGFYISCSKARYFSV